jgi:hypothetical protein
LIARRTTPKETLSHLFSALLVEYESGMDEIAKEINIILSGTPEYQRFNVTTTMTPGSSDVKTFTAYPLPTENELKQALKNDKDTAHLIEALMQLLHTPSCNARRTTISGL